MDKVQNISHKILKTKPLNKLVAQSKIRALAEDSRNIIVTNHAQERMVERDILYPEILRILKEGVIRKEPEKRAEEKYWSYKMEYIKFSGDKDAACLVAIKDTKLIIITVM
jgi:hypothetical protein